MVRLRLPTFIWGTFSLIGLFFITCGLPALLHGGETVAGDSRLSYHRSMASCLGASWDRILVDTSSSRRPERKVPLDAGLARALQGANGAPATAVLASDLEELSTKALQRQASLTAFQLKQMASVYSPGISRSFFETQRKLTKRLEFIKGILERRLLESRATVSKSCSVREPDEHM